MINYGEALREQRERANLNQPELAKKIKTSQANICRWEANKVLPNIDFCVRLADFYGITIDELIGREKPYSETNAAKNFVNISNSGIIGNNNKRNILKK